MKEVKKRNVRLDGIAKGNKKGDPNAGLAEKTRGEKMNEVR